jgi:hypothetical protein
MAAVRLVGLILGACLLTTVLTFVGFTGLLVKLNL